MNKRRQQIVIWFLGILVTTVMLSLGLWQMESFRDQGEQALIARMQEPAAALTEVAPVGQMPRDAYGRTVWARGVYLPEQQLLVSDQRDPAMHRVLTALQLADGSVVPVVRGLGPGTPDAPPDGAVEVRGVFLPSEAEADSRTALPEGQLGSIRLPRITQFWEQPLAPGFIVQQAADARAQGLMPAEVELPSNAGNARNQGYALQWWIFAAAAVAATVKLSRDAAKGTGFMASSTEPVDEPGETVENSGGFPTGDGSRTEEAGSAHAATVDKPPVT